MVAFRVEPLARAHQRKAFNSGNESLDNYFKRIVSQDIRQRVTSCFVAVTPEQRIAGFYTLASTSILLDDLPPELNKKLPRYPTVPAVRMGRLAVDLAFQGQGLGGALLADALAKTLNLGIGVYALLVDAKDAAAASFYRHHGFIVFPDSELKLFLPLETAKEFL